jgi:hypothetical protein
MTNSVVYFRPDVVAEPLFNQWYAWGVLDLTDYGGNVYCKFASENHAFIRFQSGGARRRAEKLDHARRAIHRL